MAFCVEITVAVRSALGHGLIAKALADAQGCVEILESAIRQRAVDFRKYAPRLRCASALRISTEFPHYCRPRT